MRQPLARRPRGEFGAGTTVTGARFSVMEVKCTPKFGRPDKAFTIASRACDARYFSLCDRTFPPVGEAVFTDGFGGDGNLYAMSKSRRNSEIGLAVQADATVSISAAFALRRYQEHPRNVPPRWRCKQRSKVKAPGTKIRVEDKSV